MAELAQDSVDEVDDVGAHHRYLIDNYQFYLFEQFYKVARVLHALAQTFGLKFHIVAHKGAEWQTEKGVHSLAAYIYGGYAGRSEHHIFLAGVGGDILQKCRLARAGFAG